MAKKTLILTEKQLNEISGCDFSYLDNLGKKSDIGDFYADEISAEGPNMEGYSDEITTDNFSKMQSKNWPRDSRSFGRSGNYPSSNISEMSKKDWEKKYILNEANKRLKNRFFNGKSYEASKKEGQRIRNAVKKSINGSGEEEKQKGLKTLSRMMKIGGENFGKSSKLLSNAQNADRIIQSNRPEGTKIKSTPKNTKNGIITPIN